MESNSAKFINLTQRENRAKDKDKINFETTKIPKENKENKGKDIESEFDGNQHENQKYHIFYNQKEIEEEEELLGMINLKNEKEIKELDIIGNGKIMKK